MGGLRALILIFLQAPGALRRGQFDVDEEYSVYGWPARIVAILLLYIGLGSIAGAVVAAAGGTNNFPPDLLIVWFLSFLGSVVTCAVICVACRKRRRAQEPESGDEDEDDDAGRRKPTRGWKQWDD